MNRYVMVLCSFIVAMVLFGCKNNRNVERKREAAEALIKTKVVLSGDVDSLSLSLLQPAMDYYLKNGNVDEKFQTYCLQGQLLLSLGDDDKAMESFLKAIDLKESVSDTIQIARLLEDQGLLYLKQYKVQEAIKRNVEAAQLYGAIGRPDLELRSYSKAVDGCVILHDEARARELMALCFPLSLKNPSSAKYLMPSFRAYTVEFGRLAEIKVCMSTFETDRVDNDDVFTYAKGYLKLGNYDNAFKALESVVLTRSILDSIRYNTLKLEILDAQGNIEEAYQQQKILGSLLERHHKRLFSQDLLFIEEKHQLELERIAAIQKRDHIIWTVLTIGAVAILIMGGWMYASRQKRRQRELEIKLEKKALEEERDNLKKLLKVQEELDHPLKEVIKTRLSILNGLLAKEISKNETHAKQYYKLLETIRKDKQAFINSTREFFTASHPKFIKYLQDHELSIDEINYLCLYAMGLRGVEVGEYIEVKGHYNLSSTIRKKLNLGQHDTNLASFVRTLINNE